LAVVAAFAVLIGVGALVLERRAPEAVAASERPAALPRGVVPTVDFRPAVTPAPSLPAGALGSGGAVFAPGGEIDVPVGVRWSVEGASAAAPEPADPLPGVEHFFLGNEPSRWRTGVPRHASALYRQLRPGLDVKATPRARGLTLAVTATAQVLRETWFRWDGAGEAKVEEGGRLVLATPEGPLTQTLEGPLRLAETRAVPGGGLAYRLEAEIQPTGPMTPGTYQVGVAWPYLLPTNVGSGDAVNDLHRSPDGTVVVVGSTSVGFFTGALDGGTNRAQDAYVAKFDADAGLIWGAYLGGTSGEFGEDVAFDPLGNLYVVGKTQSNNYPVFPIPGAYQVTLKGGADVFVTSLPPSGNSIRWSTYLGGTSTVNNSEDALAVGVDRMGSVWVGGYTASANFPTTPTAFDTTNTNNGGWPSSDAFIAELSDAGDALLFSSFFGGPGGGTEIYDLAFDPVSGDLIAVGDSATPNVSVGTVATPPLQPGSNGGSLEGVLLRLPIANPGQPTWFSYLGGSGGDTIEAVAVDSSGALYLGGVTSSPGFPVDGGLGYPYQGIADAFVTKVRPFPLVGIEWSTFIGGSGYDEIRALELGSNGEIWLAGQTNSPSIRDFDGGQQGMNDALVARLSPTGDSLDWGTFLGGTQNEDARGIAVDGRSNVYVAGDTSSGNFPVTHTAGNDGFLVKLDTTPPVGGMVADGPNLGSDFTYQTVSTGFGANWFGFFDPDEPVVRFEFGLGTAPGLVDVTGGWLDAGSMATGAAGGLTLAQGQTYYATVHAISLGGLVSAPVSSNGVTVDTTAPPDGGVRDGPGVDRQFQRRTDPIEANWDPMIDPTSGTVAYKVAIGSDTSDIDVLDYTDVGLSLDAGFSASLTDGKRYHVTVKAVNGAGLATSSASNGVVVDDSPPDLGTVSDGPTPGADVDAQPRTAPIEATWSPFTDLQSGIARYEYAVGTTAGGTEMRGFTSVGTATSVTANGLSLTAGTKYFVSVRAFNNAGGSNTAVSDGVVALGGDGDSCSQDGDCASNLCRSNRCLPAGTAVLLELTHDAGSPVHFGARAEISAEVMSIGAALPATTLVMTAEGLALAGPDAGSATCDQGETLAVAPVPLDQTVTVPVFAYVCRGPGGDPPSLTGHLEAPDGGRMTPDVKFDLPVDPQSVPVGCNCVSAPGAMAVAALLWMIGRRRRKR